MYGGLVVSFCFLEERIISESVNLLIYIWWGNVVNVAKDRRTVLRNRT